MLRVLGLAQREAFAWKSFSLPHINALFCCAYQRFSPMQIFVYCYAVLAVSCIHCIWRASIRHQLRRERVLRERVAFLLWTAAG